MGVVQLKALETSNAKELKAWQAQMEEVRRPKPPMLLHFHRDCILSSFLARGWPRHLPGCPGEMFPVAL